MRADANYARPGPAISAMLAAFKKEIHAALRPGDASRTIAKRLRTAKPLFKTIKNGIKGSQIRECVALPWLKDKRSVIGEK